MLRVPLQAFHFQCHFEPISPGKELVQAILEVVMLPSQQCIRHAPHSFQKIRVSERRIQPAQHLPHICIRQLLVGCVEWLIHLRFSASPLASLAASLAAVTVAAGRPSTPICTFCLAASSAAPTLLSLFNNLVLALCCPFSPKAGARASSSGTTCTTATIHAFSFAPCSPFMRHSNLSLCRCSSCTIPGGALGAGASLLKFLNAQLLAGLFEFVRVHGEVVGGEGRRCLHCQLRGGQQRQVLQQSHEVSYTIHRAINVL
mmetsp:Transcript_1547/g.3781  ORF Transcript_1547/g.3781 Transcript_1547/m.3781 type:complete len:259 (-) Transcript_1547:1831-2607(-)